MTMMNNQSGRSMFIILQAVFFFFLLIGTILINDVASEAATSTTTGGSQQLSRVEGTGRPSPSSSSSSSPPPPLLQQSLLAHKVLNDITTTRSENWNNFTPLFVPRSTNDVLDAIDDFDDLDCSSQADDLSSSNGSNSSNASSSDIQEGTSTTRGRTAWIFLRGLANSPTFARQVWQRRPLLIRSDDIAKLSTIPSSSSAGSASPSSWVNGCFTLDPDLREGVDQSFISGMRTADVMRNGTKTDTWQLEPIVNNNNMDKSKSKSTGTGAATTTKWEDVCDAINGGTVYFNTAGGLWPKLGGLCRLFMYAFGLPTNVNVYVTPPQLKLSVPPHTDRQCVFVLQAQGQKRWRVYEPSKRCPPKDPFHRGKQGDVLDVDVELDGRLIIDTILRPGDVLYVPAGFPHLTDTVVVEEKDEDESTQVGGGTRRYDESSTHDVPSLHLTMGLDHIVWHLCWAHLRWSLLLRNNLDFRVDFQDRDHLFWKAMNALPVGFLSATIRDNADNDDHGTLGLEAWTKLMNACKQQKQSPPDEAGQYLDLVAKQLRLLLIELEPDRFTESSTDQQIPSLEEMKACIWYMVNVHWRSLIENQERLFTFNKTTTNAGKDEGAMIKNFHVTQRQSSIMEDYGRFSNSESFANMYAQRRQAATQKVQGLM